MEEKTASGQSNGAAPIEAPVGGQPSAELLEMLGKTPVFSGLPPAHLRRIAEIGAEVKHPYGATVFAEGDAGDKFYIVLAGAVRISRIVPGMGEEALAILRNGAYFGEMALIDDFPRSPHALVHESCRLCVISMADL